MYDLKAFRERVQDLYRRARPYDDGRRPTQRDLAEAVSLSAPELSNRLNATKGAKLTPRDAKAIVRALADWEAIYTRAEAQELLDLVGCPSFSEAEWGAPPLANLTSPPAASLPPARPAITQSAALSPPSSNLPQPLTSFIGREQAVADVLRLVHENRLLTLTGMGGSGKTRLALEVAARLTGSFANGIWLVELAALNDPALVPQAVAKVVGVREQAAQPLTETLRQALQNRELLLVLGNCEHLVGAVAELAHQLLTGCPRLHILATSREALRTEGESIWQVLPLALPDAQAGGSWQELGRYEAVQLFVARANAARPGFRMSADNARAVRRICEEIDGLPLAIELAAARVRTLSVEQIAARLDDRFSLLTQGSRTALPRQQTLNALIDWSYDLLTPSERAMLVSLSVFAGGWTLAAAEAIGRGQEVDGNEALNLLDSLVNKSLVIAEQQGAESRYRMLETVRRYASNRLAKKDGTIVRNLHLDYFLKLTEENEAKLRGAEQKAALAVLEAEHDNLRAALAWAIESGAAEQGLTLGGALWLFWWMHGYFSEGLRWLTAILAMSKGTRTATRGKALNAAGNLALGLGDAAAAHDLYEASLAIRRELGDQRGIAITRTNLGLVASVQGDSATWRALQEEALAMQRELGDKREIAGSLFNLGVVIKEDGDYATAQLLLEESLALREELRDQWGIAISLAGLGEVAYHRGDYAAADDAHLASLRIRRDLGDLDGIAASLEWLAMVAGGEGRLRRAVRLFGAGAALRQSINAPLAPYERAHHDRRLATTRQQMDATS